MLNEKDLTLIAGKGITEEAINAQLKRFRSGFDYLDIVAPATPAKGIQVLSPSAVDSLVKYNETATVKGRCKFVPASGAASRMFKDLFAALVLAEKAQEIPTDSPAARFIANIQDFAFYTPELFDGKDAKGVLSATLLDEGLGYGRKPKGVLSFHKYPDGEIRTAFAEHLVEAQEYMKDSEGVCSLVVTVSEEHLELFIDEFERLKEAYEKRYGCKFSISFTFQDPATDTIAVDENNEPFRCNDGSLLFRPAGHGALIKNLGEIKAELICIKNIDNVAREIPYLPLTSRYKKVLMGKALQIRDRLFGYLEALDAASGDETALQHLCTEIEAYLDSELCITLPLVKFASIADKAAVVKAILNRPIRVCGMVRNEGEPGGGPFIIRGLGGMTGLQILESVQIDKNNPAAVEALAGSTHFNPVDIACCVYNYKGEKFDLSKYVDPNAGFISSKSYEGRALKALELPGLWNGAMSNWNTCFVEVPKETFNPVKTVLDLLREAHCDKA